MDFSAVPVIKVKREMDEGVKAEQSVSTPSQSCNVYNSTVYNLGKRDQRKDINFQRHFPNQNPEAPSSQSQRVFLNEASRGPGRPTHDFLSLCGGIPPHVVEPNLCGGASSPLTTQDLLQPLERANSPIYQDSEALHSDKSTKDESLSQHTTRPASVTVDRLLPLCMGSQMDLAIEVSQSQLLRLARPDRNVQEVGNKPQMSFSAPSPAREEHLVETNRSSDVTVEREHIENQGCWSNPPVNYGLSDLHAPKGSSNHGLLEGGYQPIPVFNRHWQKTNHPFVELTKRPIKGTTEDDEDDVEGSDRAKEQGKGTHFYKGEQASRDFKNLDAMASTPRSKHSATEQRRRGKINDRFQTLRNLVPHSDQKRDKASFLLEVIEYVQILQEKVRKYEGIEQGRHKERLKSMVWESCKKSAGQEVFLRDAVTKDNALILRNISSSGLAIDVKELNETRDLVRPKLILSPLASEKGALTAGFRPCVVRQNASYVNGRSAVISNGFDSSHEKTTCKSGIAKPSSKVSSAQHVYHSTLPAALVQPLSTPHIQTFACLPKAFSNTGNTDESAHLAEEPMSVVDVTDTSQASKDAKHQVQLAVGSKLCQVQEGCSPQVVALTTVTDRLRASNYLQCPSSGTFGSDQMPLRYHVNGVTATSKDEVCTYSCKNKEDARATHIRDESLAVTGGIISVSSIYSHGLLDTLTRALQTSGLDMSQATVSVQIDLGKRAGDSVAFSSEIKTTGHTLESSSQSQRSKGHARPSGLQYESNISCKKPKVQDPQKD